jgi:hypothetical protein
MLTKEQIKALQAPIPAEALKSLRGRGISLTTIDNYYVIERLNEVLGVGGWSWDVEAVDVCSFQVIVKGTLTIPPQTPNTKPTTISQYGGASYQPGKKEGFDGTDIRTVDKGDLYKGAATNSLSKVSSYLGIGGEIYGMKYKSKQKNSNSSSSPQTSSPQAKKDNRKQVLIDDKFTEDRVKNLVVLVKKENSGKAILYGKGKNKFYTNDSIYTLSPNQLLKVIENYGATVSG